MGAARKTMSAAGLRRMSLTFLLSLFALGLAQEAPTVIACEGLGLAWACGGLSPGFAEGGFGDPVGGKKY